MKRPSRLAVLVGLAGVTAVLLAACTSSENAVSSETTSPLPSVSQLASASPAPSSSATASTRSRLILDGLLKTAAGERVIEDTVAEYEARGATGLQAATRSANNPLSNYRAQLLKAGWKLNVDEATRISGQKEGNWISLTSTELETFTNNLPWATVLAFVELTVEEPEL